MKVKRFLCRAFGHKPAQLVAGTKDGIRLSAMICPRCHFIYASNIGKRQQRRARARA